MCNKCYKATFAHMVLKNSYCLFHMNRQGTNDCSLRVEHSPRDGRLLAISIIQDETVMNFLVQ